ncbi:MAG: DUF1232 domain-containing protein [Actinomycetota bacterium]
MRYLLIGFGIAVLIWLLVVAALVAFGRRGVARELTRLIPNLLVLFKGLLGDRRVPLGPKLWLGIAVLWIASPIDLIPEFIPVAGPIDDAIVALLVLRHLARKTPRNVLLEHWRGNPRTLSIIAGRASA